MKVISKYSFGVGDRFAHQGQAQLSALIKAAEIGTEFISGAQSSENLESIIRSNLS